MRRSCNLFILYRLWQGYHNNAEKVEFSGPLLSQSHRVDELLERHERHIRQAVRKSWFQRGIFRLPKFLWTIDQVKS